MTRAALISAEDRARERDPWKDTPQPPGSKEAAAAAAQLKREQAQPKRKGKRRTPTGAL